MSAFGDLSEQEYLELLAEIEIEDEDIQEAEAETKTRIAQTENNNALDRIQIQRKAFSQQVIRLSDEISQNELKHLIELLTESYIATMERCKKHIDKRITRLLNPFIPGIIKSCKAKFPEVLKPYPGFLYQAGKEYGQGYSLWVNPNIPYYFEQGTEQDIIRKEKPDALFSLDKMVSTYWRNKLALQEKELKYASLLISKKVNTYYDLLKLNPFWFDKLYEDRIKHA